MPSVAPSSLKREQERAKRQMEGGKVVEVRGRDGERRGGGQ